jgi:hypothetical protein
VKLRNELQTIRVTTAGDRTVEGVVRVRGVDARVGRRGFIVERQTPVAVVVHTHAGVRRLALPRYDAVTGVAAALAGPMLFLATKRYFWKGRRR